MLLPVSFICSIERVTLIQFKFIKLDIAHSHTRLGSLASTDNPGPQASFAVECCEDTLHLTPYEERALFFHPEEVDGVSVRYGY